VQSWNQLRRNRLQRPSPHLWQSNMPYPLWSICLLNSVSHFLPLWVVPNIWIILMAFIFLHKSLWGSSPLRNARVLWWWVRQDWCKAPTRGSSTQLRPLTCKKSIMEVLNLANKLARAGERWW
jgi:hypothetical protein